jgi:hypothetical protein
MGSAEHERAPGQHGGQQRLAATTIDHASFSVELKKLAPTCKQVAGDAA